MLLLISISIFCDLDLGERLMVFITLTALVTFVLLFVNSVLASERGFAPFPLQTQISTSSA